VKVLAIGLCIGRTGIAGGEIVMKPNYLNRADLAAFGKHTATQVANGKVSGLLAEQVASISAAIAEASAELAETDRLQMQIRAAALEATTIAQEKRILVLKLLQDLKYLMKGLGCALHEFVAVGFDEPVIGRHPVVPQIPQELSATGYSNGVNMLRFSGNNGAGRVTYTIEAKIGDSPTYAMIGTSKSQRFKHINVTPGMPVLYRIRAQTSRGWVSNWSNEAAVYLLE
jgi:hypothetical protein